MYKNSEGIADPTAGSAMESISRDRRRYVDEVLKHTRNGLALCDIELVEMQVKDTKTGKRYRR